MLLWAVADGVGCEEETMPLPALPVNQSESVFTTNAGFKRGEGGRNGGMRTSTCIRTASVTRLQWLVGTRISTLCRVLLFCCAVVVAGSSSLDRQSISIPQHMGRISCLGRPGVRGAGRKFPNVTN